MFQASNRPQSPPQHENWLFRIPEMLTVIFDKYDSQMISIVPLYSMYNTKLYSKLKFTMKNYHTEPLLTHLLVRMYNTCKQLYWILF